MNPSNAALYAPPILTLLVGLAAAIVTAWRRGWFDFARPAAASELPAQATQTLHEAFALQAKSLISHMETISASLAGVQRSVAAQGADLAALQRVVDAQLVRLSALQTRMNEIEAGVRQILDLLEPPRRREIG